MRKLLILLCALLLPIQGYAATSVGSTGGNSGSGTTLAVTITGVTANSTIVCGTMLSGATHTVTMADGQGSYTAADTILRHTSESLQAFYLKAANSGSHTITATYSGSNAETYLYCVEVIGAHTTAPLGTVAQGTGASTNLATAATLSGSSGDMILAFGGNETAAETYTKGATFDAITTTGQLFGETRILAGSVSFFAANASMSSSDEWVIQGVTIAQDGGAAPPDTTKFRLRVQP